MSEKMPRSGENEGHLSNGRSHEERIEYDDRSSPAFGSLVSEIMGLCAAPGSKRYELECLLSRYMRKEGDIAEKQMLHYREERNSVNQINVTRPRNLQLKFINKVCDSVFTGVPIKGENCQPLIVALVDGQSEDFVTFGPEASARVEIVALDPDFGGFVGDSGEPNEFENKIITKEGKTRVLTGNVVLDLSEGIGYAGTFQFSHTKIWKKQRAYRLGAIATDDYIQTKIRAGFTDSFFVKDHRLDLNKKHHPPSLVSEVWRLVGISRDGAFHQRLSDKEVNIHTLEDFLKKLNTDPKKLRDILGKGMSTKMWEALVNHARTCIVDETLYFYSSSECLRQTNVLFNMVGQVMGLISEAQYVSFEMLSESEKAHAMNLVLSAFQDWDKVVSLDDEASFNNFLEPREDASPTMESSSGINILNPPESNDIDLPQTVTSFEDKSSAFDESYVPSYSSYPPESLALENSNGSKMTIPPETCELGYGNRAVSLDEESLFDESQSQNFIIFPPEHPKKERSTTTGALISQDKNELIYPPTAFSIKEDNILFNKPPGPSYDACSLKSPTKENCNFSKTLVSPEIDELDFLTSIAPSEEFLPPCDSVWEMSYYNDYNVQYADHTSHRHVRHLSYSTQMTDSDNWEIESTIPSFWEENQDIPLQFFDEDFPLYAQDNLQNDGSGSWGTLPTVALVNNARKRYLRNKAKRKWRVLFSMMKWLFLWRNAAKKLPINQVKVKLNSSYEDLRALDIGDFVIPTPCETKSFQFFDSQTPVLSRNLSLNSEANLHSVVNDILLARSFAVATNISQRKYMPKREKARRRWTKLYSVMKWFLVQRKVTKRASSAFALRGPSCSSSIDNISPILAMGNSSYDASVSTTAFACLFQEDQFLKLFNAICSLQPRNRIAMNKLARRRNIADPNFAKKKWRMLFSIMKWLSVRRSATRVMRPYNTS